MMKSIKIGFVDFYRGFQAVDHYFYWLLSAHYHIEIDNIHPDYLFFSVFGNEHLKYKDCIKIFWTGECQSPDFNFCDYAIGFDEIQFGDRYFRLPLYFLYKDYDKMCQKHMIQAEELKQKIGFCSFVYSNNNASPVRQQIYDAVSTYKPIASGGRYNNNVGGYVKDKIEFQSKYKFCIACENSSMPGYSTEKLMQAFASRTIPIYWGDPHITNQFNAKSFINVSDFATLDQVVDAVRKIDTHDELYLDMIHQPALLDLHLKEKTEQDLMLFFQNIFDQNPQQARRYNRVYWGEKIRQDRLQEVMAKEKSFKGRLIIIYNKYLFTYLRNQFPKIHLWLMKHK